MFSSLTHCAMIVLVKNINSDSEKIAEKVAACLDYPSFMENIRGNARNTIEEHYALDKMLHNRINIMKQLTKAAPKNGNRFG